MGDEKASDEGIMDKAKRLADRVGDYARSEEAQKKIDAVKQNAVKASGMATAGAKKLVEGTKQAAAQAKVKADEFSKSERGEAIKATVKEDWDEIRGGSFRGSRLSKSPLVVGLAIFLFFPVGLYLLWKHPVLGGNKRWWWAGGAWGLLITLAVFGRNGDGAASPKTLVLREDEVAGAPPSDRGAGAKVAFSPALKEVAVQTSDPAQASLAELALLQYESYGPYAPLAASNGSPVEPLEKQIVKEFWDITRVYAHLLTSEIPEDQRGKYDIRAATLKNIEGRYGVTEKRITDILIKGGQWMGQGLIEPLPRQDHEIEAWARRHKAEYNVQWPIAKGRTASSTDSNKHPPLDSGSRMSLYGDYQIALTMINRTLDDDPLLAKARKPSKDPLNHLHNPEELRASRLKGLADRLIQHLAKSYKTDPSAIPIIIAEGDKKGWAERPVPGRPSMIVPASTPQRGSYYARRPGVAERQRRDGWLADNGDIVTIESQSGRVALYDSRRIVASREDQRTTPVYEQFVLYVPSPVNAVIETADELETEVTILDGPYMGCRGWVSKYGLRFMLTKPSR